VLPETAIPLINNLGKAKVPFLVMTDFESAKIQVHRLDELNESILFDFGGYTNQNFYKTSEQLPALQVEPYSFYNYYHEFDKVKDALLYGNSFLINLTAKHKIETEASLLDIYAMAKARYKLYVEDKFVVFSPEAFVKIEDGIISSYPMKGTIDASLPNAKEQLLSDEKEKAEHYTIVDLIRNDLSIYARQVEVTKFRYIDLIKSSRNDLYQMSSEIKGRLPNDYHAQLGDIIFSLLPAGSISGAPKKKTVELIRQIESSRRGYYSGICGIFDGKNFDSCVMIRYIENDDGQLYYRSGGGINFMSEVEKEYLEMIDKIYIPLG